MCWLISIQRYNYFFTSFDYTGGKTCNKYRLVEEMENIYARTCGNRESMMSERTYEII